MVPLLIDHDVTDIITQGIVDHFSDVDLARAKDVGLAEAADDELLTWTAENGRVIVSSDTKTMTAAANHRLSEGQPMLGLIVVRQSVAYRVAIEDIAMIAFCSEPSEWVSRVEYLPLVR
jgi:hypothetical protein